ncbi:MAG TPA: M14 family zinc carboxypeptidase [Longimicrobiales bacterium]|nr:M14 family zinc carboxypeptidase [Longimicrobiales bacterium]
MLGSFALLALLQISGAPGELAPGTRYDPSIPTLEDVAGHGFQEEITPPDAVVRYMEALAEAAPDRTRLLRYAESWEERPLVVLVIGSAARMGRLDEILAGLARLAEADIPQAEADRLVAELPVVTALMHGIHGNELSSSGAAMAEAYHLLAARGDPTVDLILSESLVLIDPLENPDGRARFVQQNLMSRSRWPDPTPYAAEHDEPWPGGRTNHYLFDLNRDLFIQSQPETRGRVEVFLEYRPQIVVDLHEMGGNSTYFFPPTAPPENPWFGERQIGLMDVFGRANAEAFDRRGFSYFNRDRYDLFYPGYVDGWLMGQGALGMTYEQASARGLIFTRSDGDLLAYGDGVLHHFTAAITTAATAARNRERILRDYLAFRREGIELGGSSPREYVIHSAHDPTMAERLARLLVRNGIDVRAANGPVTIAGRRLPESGTFIVPLAQPTSRFARNLLDAHVSMDTVFVQRQIDRRSRRQPDEIYDLTAWSQSLLWDVEAMPSERSTGALGSPVEPEPVVEELALPEAVVGYLMPWGTSTASAVVEALREGIRVRAVGGPFTLGGREYAIGTALVRTADNGADLRERLGRIAGAHGAEVVPIDDSYVTDGTSLGSGTTRALREPRVLLVYDEPTVAYSAGWARYVLERRYAQRTTVVRASSLGRVLLAEHDVVVLPSGSYSDQIGAGLVEDLRGWLEDGGTLITIAGATAWAARAELLSTTAERRGGRSDGDEPDGPDTPEQPIDYLEQITPADEAPEAVPGAILKVLLDRDHWLTAGTDGEIGALVEGTRVFTPITLDNGTNVGRYGDLDELILSGIVWEESRPQLASKAFLIHEPVGSGQIVAFAEDPNYRAYAEATQLLFMNAVLLGPGR